MIKTSNLLFFAIGSCILFLKGRTTAVSVDPCNNQCQNGALCVAGAADFSNHTTWENNTLDIHAETSINGGYHCECPFGWTGVRCDIMYEPCRQQEDLVEHDDEHHREAGYKCYHGGQCISGLAADEYQHERFFCDCSQAKDSSTGDIYIGKYCEHRSTNFCDDSDGNFCLNGGECNLNYPDEGPACLCLSGHEGKHCEFKSGSVPRCDLDCKNGGQCVLGQGSGTITNEISHYWETNNNHTTTANVGLLLLDDHMYCSCPHGYDGPTCEIKKESCGEDHCYHGSTCVVANGNHYCDCNSANNDNAYNDLSYAGRYCQYEATRYCTKDGDIFCVNDGTCNMNRPYEGCTCPSGWAGFSCEIPVSDDYHTSSEETFDALLSGLSGQPIDNDAAANDNVVDTIDQLIGRTGNESSISEESSNIDYDSNYGGCDLDCKNGGTCRKGSKYYGDDLTEIIKDIAHLNITASEDFDHCVCPRGFMGLYCEHEIQICGNGEHQCLHGSQCVSNNMYDSAEEHACDCSTTTSNTSSLIEHAVFAGKSCEHKATQICTRRSQEDDVGDTSIDGVGVGPARPLSFCVNGGICLRHVTIEEEHPGCVCLDGWEGPHCELKMKMTTLEEQPQQPQEESHLANDYDATEQPQQQQQQQSHLNNDDDATEPPEENFEENIELESAVLAIEVGSVEQTVTGKQVCSKVSAIAQEPMSYCANGGTCLRIVETDEEHPGCVCLEGWAGARCEGKLPEIEVAPNSSSFLPNSRARLRLMILLGGLSAVIILILMGMASIMKQKRRLDSKRHLEIGNSSSSAVRFFSGYRDAPPMSPNTNLAPARDICIDPIPGRRFQASSTSDMMMMTGMAPSDFTPNIGSGGASVASGRSSVAGASTQSANRMAPSDSTPSIGSEGMCNRRGIATAAATTTTAAISNGDDDGYGIIHNNQNNSFEYV